MTKSDNARDTQYSIGHVPERILVRATMANQLVRATGANQLLRANQYEHACFWATRVVRLLSMVEVAAELDHPRMCSRLGNGQSQTVLRQPEHPSFSAKQHIVDVLLRTPR